MEPSVPLPLDPAPPPEADDKRLWIGNIDSRVTEYNLLKMVQQFGDIKKFDFLFHKTGILKGQPRGYSFVTYETREQAERALQALNGKTVLEKDLVVKWAHTVPAESSTSKKSDLSAPKIQTEDKETKNVLQQIMAIESKLKAMEEQRDRELEMCLSAIPLAADNPLLVHARNKNSSRQKPRSVPYNRSERKHRSHPRRYIKEL